MAGGCSSSHVDYLDLFRFDYDAINIITMIVELWYDSYQYCTYQEFMMLDVVPAGTERRGGKGREKGYDQSVRYLFFLALDNFMNDNYYRKQTQRQVVAVSKKLLRWNT